MSTVRAFTKIERRTFSMTAIRYLLSLSWDELHEFVRTDELRKVFVEKVALVALLSLKTTYVGAWSVVPESFALDKLCTNEVSGIFGELTKRATTLGGFTASEMEKLANIGGLLKKKEAGQKRPRLEEGSSSDVPVHSAVQSQLQGAAAPNISHSEVGASSESTSLSLSHIAQSIAVLSLISEDQLKFVTEPHIGRGAFGTVVKVQVINHPYFLPTATYAGKIFNRGDDVGMHAYNAAQLAEHEASILPFRHAGIISGLGLAKYSKKPTLIMRYWNGCNVDYWLWKLRTDHSTPLPSNFPAVTAGSSNRVMRNIFRIINVILRTVDHLHNRGFVHNDLHKGNVLLHFPGETDSVYVGISDWSRCTKVGSEWKCYRPEDTSAPSLQQYRRQYPYIAPECFATKPTEKTYFASCKQDIFSVSFMVRELLNLYIRNPHSLPYQRFIDHVQHHVSRGLVDNPKERPEAYVLLEALHGAVAMGVKLSETSGFRPDMDF